MSIRSNRLHSRTEPSTSDVVAALSAPVTTDENSLNRRRFLQAAGAATAVTMMPNWLASQAEAAVPLGPSDGVLVLITMAGGNDSLNTVVPITDGTYYSQRGGLAIGAGNTLPIDGNRGFHPSLGTLKAQWDQGNVAIIEGVGHPDPDLSHFTSMARVMGGAGGSGSASSGWIGRYIDDLPGGDDPFHAVTMGYSVPLLMRGNQRTALALPNNSGGLFSADTQPWAQRQYAAIHTMGANARVGGVQGWGEELAVSASESLLVANQLGGAYGGAVPEGKLAGRMTLAARLINANFGIRVFHILYGDFDSHAGQPAMHNDRMAELEAGLAAFYAELSSTYAGRAMVLTTSEFGRRIKSNDSSGTDHGAASSWLAVGAGVKGGIYGQVPSLANPDNRGNIRTAVDFRNVYSTVLDRWLGGDGASIVGSSYPDLGFLHGPASGPASDGGDNGPATIVVQRQQISRLYLAYFLRMPDHGGLSYWQRQLASSSLAQVSESFARSDEFIERYGSLNNRQFVQLVYQNVLDRGADNAGLDFWSSRLAGGESRGRVMIGFSESAEFIAATRAQLLAADTNGPIARLYWAYYLRQPDSDGLQYWLATGLPLHEVSEAFARTPEFNNLYGILNDDAFVSLVYRNVMEREPDAAGLAFWKTQLRSGLSRGALMVNFSESDEFIARRSG